MNAAELMAHDLIVVGRTSTPELGNHCATEPVLGGPTLNPWRHDISPGGSSGGVALDGLGVKHALTRSVRDSAIPLDVVSGIAAGDPWPAPPPQRPFVEETDPDAVREPVRILHAERPPFPGEVDARVQQIADAASAALQGLGHDIVTGVAEIDPEVVRRSISVIHPVDNAATVAWLEEYLGREPAEDELEPVTWDMAHEGQTLGEVDGLPVGVQLIAPSEAPLLALATQLEQAMPWAGRHPPASPGA